jgi:hypothetical protein
MKMKWYAIALGMGLAGVNITGQTLPLIEVGSNNCGYSGQPPCTKEIPKNQACESRITTTVTVRDPEGNYTLSTPWANSGESSLTQNDHKISNSTDLPTLNVTVSGFDENGHQALENFVLSHSPVTFQMHQIQTIVCAEAKKPNSFLPGFLPIKKKDAHGNLVVVNAQDALLSNPSELNIKKDASGTWFTEIMPASDKKRCYYMYVPH